MGYVEKETIARAQRPEPPRPTLSKDKQTLEKVKAILNESEQKDEPLLVIELQDESSIPKVLYKGKEITYKIRVSFDWETKREHEGTGGVRFNVDYFNKETNSFHVIGRRDGEFK